MSNRRSAKDRKATQRLRQALGLVVLQDIEQHRESLIRLLAASEILEADADPDQAELALAVGRLLDALKEQAGISRYED